MTNESELKKQILKIVVAMSDGNTYNNKDFEVILDEAKKEYPTTEQAGKIYRDLPEDFKQNTNVYLILTDLRNTWFKKWFGEST